MSTGGSSTSADIFEAPLLCACICAVCALFCVMLCVKRNVGAAELKDYTTPHCEPRPTQRTRVVWVGEEQRHEEAEKEDFEPEGLEGLFGDDKSSHDRWRATQEAFEALELYHVSYGCRSRQ